MCAGRRRPSGLGPAADEPGGAAVLVEERDEPRRGRCRHRRRGRSCRRPCRVIEVSTKTASRTPFWMTARWISSVEVSTGRAGTPPTRRPGPGRRPGVRPVRGVPAGRHVRATGGGDPDGPQPVLGVLGEQRRPAGAPARTVPTTRVDRGRRARRGRRRAWTRERPQQARTSWVRRSAEQNARRAKRVRSGSSAASTAAAAHHDTAIRAAERGQLVEGGQARPPDGTARRCAFSTVTQTTSGTVSGVALLRRRARRWTAGRRAQSATSSGSPKRSVVRAGRRRSAARRGR